MKKVSQVKIETIANLVLAGMKQSLLQIYIHRHRMVTAAQPSVKWPGVCDTGDDVLMDMVYNSSHSANTAGC